MRERERERERSERERQTDRQTDRESESCSSFLLMETTFKCKVCAVT